MSLNVNSDNNYVKSINVTGNLNVEGVIYVYFSKNKIPDELKNTELEPIYNTNLTLKGNLHVYPGSVICSGKLKSGKFQTIN
tara:strand:+ start:163 stop:408 length:246 start_codon:yes stop_codon:yes gene_type:complete